MERIGLEPGAEVGGYEIVAPLGSGAMGAVYRAVDAEGTAVALKVLHPSVASDPEARARLQREVEVLRKVRHPGVAQVLDAESDADDLFIVTELVEGPTLEDEVLGAGALDADDLFDLADQLRLALQAVHDAGVIHRDLKASNVLLGPEGPVLIDFGISQAIGDARVTRTGLVMGTPAYLAPELVDGAEPSTVTDWWGFAALVAFAATGRTPFGTRPVDVVLARARSGNPDLSGLGERTALALRAALSPNPELRLEPAVVVEALQQARDDGDAMTAQERIAFLPAAIQPGGAGVRGLAGGVGGTEVVGSPTKVLPAVSAELLDAPDAGAGSQSDATADDAAGGGAPYLDEHRGGDTLDGIGADDAPPIATGYVRPRLRFRSGTTLALGLPLVAAAPTWPGFVVVILLVVLITCRMTGITHDGFHTRRERRGVRPHDVGGSWVRAPWNLVRTVVGIVPSLLVSATAVLLVGGVGWWLLDNEKIVGGQGARQIILLVCGIILIVVLWFGPLTYLARLGGRVIVSSAVPRGWPVILVWVVALAVSYALARSWLGGHEIVWSPFPAPPDLAH